MSEPHTARSIEIFAPAKINWYLKILRRRPDGFHDLDTVFQTLDVGDTLRMTQTETLDCRISLNLAHDLLDEFSRSIPTEKANLIHKAWRQMATAYPAQARGVVIEVDKQLPGGAGLGGGSSDAAATIAGLNQLWELELDPATMERHAASLGSDCAFFIRGGAARGTGRGEQLTPVSSNLTGLYILLVWPGFPSATAAAYRALDPAALTSDTHAPELMQAMHDNDHPRLFEFIENTFNPVVLGQDFRYNSLIKQIQASGAKQFELCGSGSTLFITGSDRSVLESLADRLRDDYAWVRVCTPSPHGVCHKS